MIQIDISGPGGRPPRWAAYLPGGALILIGLLILLLPQLLQFLIGGAFLVIGIGLVMMAARL